MIRTKTSDSIFLSKEQVLYHISHYSKSAFFLTNKFVVGLFGWVSAGVLTNLIDKQHYFIHSGKCTDGWFYQTTQQQSEILKLSEYQIRVSKKELMENGILITEMRGLPAKEWYFIDYSRLQKLIEMGLTAIHQNPGGLLVQNPDELPHRILTNIPLIKPYIIKTNIKKPEKISQNPTSNPLLQEPSKPKKTLSAKQNVPIKGQAIEWSKVTNKLANFMDDKLDIHMSTEDKSTSTYGHIKKLNISNKIPISRILAVIEWLSDHYKDEFVPMIGSAQDFYYKFAKLELTMNKTSKPKACGYLNKDQSPYDEIKGVTYDQFLEGEN